MDPDKNLQEMLKTAKKIISDYDDPTSNGIDQDDANYLADLVISMDEWLSKGGFKPKRWEL